MTALPCSSARIRPLVSALAMACGLGVLSGCYSSQDRSVYESRTWSPKTVVLVDSRTEEELWRYDLPVGARLTINFYKGDADNLLYPDEMRWKARSTIGTSFKDAGEVPCPPEGVRRLDMYLRPAPEYPKPDAPPAEPLPLPQAEPEPSASGQGEPAQAEPAPAQGEPGGDGQQP